MAAIELFNTPLFNDASLVHYYRMEGNSNDAKGSSNGTDSNITYSSGNGKFGQGAGFNSASPSMIQFTDDSTWHPTVAFTLHCWVKTSTTGNFKALIESFSQPSNAAGIQLRIRDTNFAEVASAKNTGTTQGTDFQTAVGSTNVCDGNYHMITGTWDGSNLRIYVDGVLDATAVSWANAPVYASPNYPILGRERDATSTFNFPLNGDLDDVALFSRALSATEISNLFNGTFGTQEELSGNYDAVRAQRRFYRKSVAEFIEKAKRLGQDITDFVKNPSGIYVPEREVYAI